MKRANRRVIAVILISITMGLSLLVSSRTTSANHPFNRLFNSVDSATVTTSPPSDEIDDQIEPLGVVTCGTPGIAVSNVAVAQNPRAIAIGDINNDGNDDFVTASQTSPNISLRLGNGAGGFVNPTLPATTEFALPANPFSVALGDFNKDGNLDFVAPMSSNNRVSIRMGNGSGVFTAPATPQIIVGAAPADIAVGDFNKDGHLDFVTSNFDNTVSIRLGDGTGSFTVPDIAQISVGLGPTAITVADLNNDGNLDFATANQGVTAGNDTVSIRLGDGDGGFTSPATPEVTVGDSPQDLSFGDFDKDGDLDMVVANSTSNTISIRLNNGAGNFTNAATPQISTNTSPIDPIVLDFNGDGNLDIAVSDLSQNNIQIFRGDGAAGFSALINNVPAFTARDLVSGDFNKDGKTDLLCTLFSGSVVLVVRNTLTSICDQFQIAAATGSPFATGTAPAALVTADLNLDGRLDIATANRAGSNITVLLGNSAGGYTAASGSPFSTGGTLPNSIVVGDFNRDGRPDLATANETSNNISVFLGNGNGSFNAAAGSPISSGGQTPLSLATGDINQDGRLDLIVGNGGSSNNIYILLGNGNGGFSAATGSPFAAGGNSPVVTVGDFNNDSRLDIATANRASNSYSVFLGNGTGAFNAVSGSPFNVGGANPFQIITSDLNKDGRLDLITVNLASNNLSILLGNGNGSFSAASGSSIVTGGNQPRGLTAGDINSDGRIDLIAVHQNTNNIAVLLGDGTGGFNAVTGSPFAAGGSVPSGVILADFNRAGKLDIAVTLSSSDNLAVFFNTCLSAPNSISRNSVISQNTNINTAFATPFQIIVRDINNNLLPNAPVFFDAPLSGPSGTFTGGLDQVMVLADANGVATAPTFTANGTAGSYNVTASVNNGSVNICTSFNLTNNAGTGCPSITIDQTSPTFTTTTNGFFTLTFNGMGGTAPYTFSLSVGPLPTGITLAGDGTLSGITNQLGSFPFTVMVTDSNGCTGTRSYTLNVICSTITLISAPSILPTGSVNQTYGGARFLASGGSNSFTFSATGNLPPGLTLAANGMLTGTPTQMGSFTFNIIATDTASTCTGMQQFTISISCPIITVSGTPPIGMIGVSYSASFSAGGGSTPYTFTFTGNLPPGLSLSNSGILSGIPSAAGDFSFTVIATDVNGCQGQANFTITVTACPTITINPAVLTNEISRNSYREILSAVGGTAPYSFALISGSLPTGLSLSSIGIISGTPTSNQPFTFTVQVTDANSCTATRTYTLAICSLQLQPISGSARLTQQFNETLQVVGGSAPYSFRVASGALPDGLKLSNGVISGTPTRNGEYRFNIVATDSSNCSTNRTYDILVTK